MRESCDDRNRPVFFFSSSDGGPSLSIVLFHAAVMRPLILSSWAGVYRFELLGRLIKFQAARMCCSVSIG